MEIITSSLNYDLDEMNPFGPVEDHCCFTNPCHAYTPQCDFTPCCHIVQLCVVIDPCPPVTIGVLNLIPAIRC